MGWAEYVAIGIFIAGLFSAAINRAVTNKNKEIDLLKQKNEAQRETISDLRNQNLKLEITGIAVNKILSQLPASGQNTSGD